jgi:membrane dipeptidase
MAAYPMWKRRDFLKCSLLVGATVSAPRRDYSARAVDLVRESVVIDMLGLLTLDWTKLNRWQREAGAFDSGAFQKLRESGVTVFHPAVALNASRPFDAIRDWAVNWNAFIGRYPDEFLRVDGPADFARAKRAGKAGIILGLQNSDHFRTAEDVAFFYGLGQRVSQLTYNSQNSIGAGCGVAHDPGLTDYGAQVVEEMNRIGMAVDISHTGDRTGVEAIRMSKKPVLITHSNCRALNPHPRCKPDDVIHAMAARGGVMGITAIRSFVGGQRATIEDVLDHFGHVARIAGIEHVGVGSDNDVEGGRPARHADIAGLDGPQRIFNLTEGLIRRGYSGRDIRLILGGNFQRALSEIWAA